MVNVIGLGYISVDPWFLVGDYPSLAKVIDESMRTNDSQPQFVLNRIYEIMEENGIADNRRVGLYGITYKEIVENQVLDFDEFLEGVDMAVIMVKHDHIKQNWDKLKGKVILDCHNICPKEMEKVYYI